MIRMDTPDETPVDADVDLSVPAERAELRPSVLPVLGAIAIGGVAGALARYGLAEAFPHDPGQFAWSTFAANVSGCLLIGVLMTMVSHVWTGRRLVRPFLGVGVLGGYTTFSTYAVEIEEAVSAGAARTALLYLAGTLVAALLAVWAGAALTSTVIHAVRRHSHRQATP